MMSVKVIALAGCALVLAACNGEAPVRSIHGSGLLISDSLPRPEGYELRLLKDSPPKFHYYLALEPKTRSPTRKPIRDESELLKLWHAAAQAQCARLGKGIVNPSAGFPGNLLPGLCDPYPGEPDCGPMTVGRFSCE